MGARFEVDVENSAASFFSGLLQSENFGVLDPCKVWEPSPTNLALWSTITAPTQGLGEVKPIPCTSQLKCMAEKGFVVFPAAVLARPARDRPKLFAALFRFRALVVFLDVIGS